MSVKKEILFVTCWYPKNGSSDGIFVKRHAIALQKAGYSITVFVARIGSGSSVFKKVVVESVTEDGITLIECEIRSKFWKFLYTIYPLLRFVLRKEIRSISTRKIDVVQSNIMHPASIIGHSISQRKGIPHAIIEHHSRLGFYLNHFVFKWGLRRVLSKSNALIFVSEFLRSSVSDNIKNVPTYVVPNVIDAEVFSNLEIHSPHPKKLRILAIANWQQGKNFVKRPDLIFDALNSLKDEFDVEMEFIGGGNYVNSMKQIAHNFDLNCTFSLEQDAEYINKRLNEVDFFFHASEIETFSLVVVEALQVGVPVLASNVGAIPEHINERNGLLVENTSEAWRRGAKDLMKKEYSRTEISTEILGRYSNDVVAEKLGVIYENILLAKQ